MNLTELCHSTYLCASEILNTVVEQNFVLRHLAGVELLLERVVALACCIARNTHSSADGGVVDLEYAH